MRSRVLVLFVVVLAGLPVVGCGDDDDTTTTSTSCELAGKGLELLAEHVHDGEPVATILAATAVPFACNYLVKTLVEEPYEPVSVKIDLPRHESTYFAGTGEELIAPAPAPEPSPEIDLERLIACVQSYSIQVLVDDCYDEVIEP